MADFADNYIIQLPCLFLATIDLGPEISFVKLLGVHYEIQSPLWSYYYSSSQNKVIDI